MFVEKLLDRGRLVLDQIGEIPWQNNDTQLDGEPNESVS